MLYIKPSAQIPTFDWYELHRDELQPFIHLHIFDMTYAFRPNQVFLR